MFLREGTHVSRSLCSSAIRSHIYAKEAFPNLEWRVVGRPRGNEILEPFLPTVERADFIPGTPFIPLARRFGSRIYPSPRLTVPLSLSLLLELSLFAPRGQRSFRLRAAIIFDARTVCRLTDLPCNLDQGIANNISLSNRSPHNESRRKTGDFRPPSETSIRI